MIRLFSILLFGLLLFSIQTTTAVPVPLENDEQANVENSNYTKDTEEEDFNFDENSFNISDEQSQNSMNATDTTEENQKENFDDKIINSSHFSSGTPSKTWVPLNKRK